ncbi:MAG: wax ester/triacylglycerol synthase domain-containing protein, partial [Solirubrobacterales bacterium]
MSHADVAWLHMDQPTNLMVITGVLWFGEVPAWDRVREVIAERLVAPFPRFRQLVIEGGPALSGPHWEEDPNFDLDLHLHRVALPPPGDRAALQALVADLTSTPLDHSRPLWQFHLVDGYGEGAAMIARIHHAIADGIALARVLLSLTDSSPEAGLAPAVEGPAAGSARSPLGALAGSARSAAGLARGAAGAIAHESLEVARHPSHLVDIAATTRRDADVVAKALLPAPDPPSPLKGEMGVAKGVAWSAPIGLAAVKAMGHETGTTINDIVVTAVAGALRRYLRSRDGLVEELTASVPFNLRPLDQPLPSELGNRFGLVLLRLPLGIGDRRRRLREVHRRMEEIKH